MTLQASTHRGRQQVVVHAQLNERDTAAWLPDEFEQSETVYAGEAEGGAVVSGRLTKVPEVARA